MSLAHQPYVALRDAEREALPASIRCAGCGGTIARAGRRAAQWRRIRYCTAGCSNRSRPRPFNRRQLQPADLAAGCAVSPASLLAELRAVYERSGGWTPTFTRAAEAALFRLHLHVGHCSTRLDERLLTYLRAHAGEAIPQRVLADVFAVRRESVSRAIGRLRAAGLIVSLGGNPRAYRALA